MSSGTICILGIDPGTASTGFGVVESRPGGMRAVTAGVISTSSGEPLERRLAAIAARVEELVEAHQPHAVAVEDIFFGRNVRTAFAVGQARGAVLAIAGARGLPCSAYTPQAIKLAVCGRGAPANEHVHRNVAALLILAEPPPSDQPAHAQAVAICHANQLPVHAAQAPAT
jgi:crossover junction endodeoxyribonuclease RuvC